MVLIMAKAKTKPLKLIPTIYPQGYKEWLSDIKLYNKAHNFLPAHLAGFKDSDGWLQCFYLNCYGSFAIDHVLGHLALPKKRLMKSRYVDYEREIHRFMNYHKLGGEHYEKESEHGINAMYSQKLTTLQAIDCIQGLRSLEGESA